MKRLHVNKSLLPGLENWKTVQSWNGAEETLFLLTYKPTHVTWPSDQIFWFWVIWEKFAFTLTKFTPSFIWSIVNVWFFSEGMLTSVHWFKRLPRVSFFPYCRSPSLSKTLLQQKFIPERIELALRENKFKNINLIDF